MNNPRENNCDFCADEVLNGAGHYFNDDRICRECYDIAMNPAPQQPEGHESRCLCMKCEDWANNLLDWESANPNHPDNPNSKERQVR